MAEKENIEEIEAVEVQVEKAEEFVKKNKNILTGAIAVIVLAIGGFLFVKNQNAEAEKEAQLNIYAAQYYFGLDSLDIVLDGDGNNVIGMSEIAEDYSGTKAGNTANFYAGVVELKKGNFEDAINYLNQFSSSDLLVQSRAYSLIGDANMELGNVDEAISYYKKASANNPNKQYTPRYLLKLALAYESKSQTGEAINTYDEIIKSYYTSQESATAQKYKAYLEAKSI